MLRSVFINILLFDDRILVETVDVTHSRRVTFISALAYFLSKSLILSLSLSHSCSPVLSSRPLFWKKAWKEAVGGNA